jgi:hypothetical protein
MGNTTNISSKLSLNSESSGELTAVRWRGQMWGYVGNTGVQLTVGRYGVLVDVGCGLGS